MKGKLLKIGQDPVEWIGEQWVAREQPGVDQFAALGAMMRTYQLIVVELDRLLKPHELSRTAFLLMAALLISRDHTRPQIELSRHLMVHPTMITLVLDQLCAKNLVSRAPHPPGGPCLPRSPRGATSSSPRRSMISPPPSSD